MYSFKSKIHKMFSTGYNTLISVGFCILIVGMIILFTQIFTNLSMSFNEFVGAMANFFTIMGVGLAIVMYADSIKPKSTANTQANPKPRGKAKGK